MKIARVVCVYVLMLSNCQTASHDPTVVANKFIDAFYSFDRDSLTTILSAAKASQPSILYYQGWAKCGSYQVLMRSDCIIKNDSLVICPVTVKDDLMAGLNIDFNVTDSFHITVVNGQIRSVATSSNDPDEYYTAKDWVKLNRPELIEKPCEGIWEGGPTPCECIQGMIQGFREFASVGK